MPPRLKIRTGDIDWRRVEHVEATLSPDEKEFGLRLRPVDEPFPKVTIITLVTDPILFQSSVFSWKNMAYPQELLNWIILDPEKMLTTTDFNDSRVRVLTTKIVKLYNTVKAVMDLEWGSSISTDVVPLVARAHNYMFMECGDVMFPDTLIIKHRSIVLKKKECVIPDGLAYYDPWTNSNLVYKYYTKIPRNGLYWKKSWWNLQSSEKMVGLPYIGNCITIGTYPERAEVSPASFPFFKNFALEIKELIKMIIRVNTQLKDQVND